MTAAWMLGGSSMALLAAFLFCGPFHFVALKLPTGAALTIDAALCLLFFTQHSLMVRKSFQKRLSSVVPPYCQRAIYAVASGVALLALVIFWQPTAPTLFSVQGAARWLLRSIFLGSALGFLWGIKSLGAFDAFGVQPIKAHLHKREFRPVEFTIKGPYRWVRHPLYSFALVLIWFVPDYSADRLLLNLSWSVWIVIGTLLEERDLVTEFGPKYTDYKKNVPMLVPWRRSKAEQLSDQATPN